MRFFGYDSLRRMVSATNPESGTVTYGYDNAGNLISRTDNRGITTTNWYDALNRLVQTAYSDGTPTATFGYDAGNVANSLGHLTSVANGNSTTNYTSFDSMGNVLASNQITTGWTYSFSYTYNLAGGLASETYPSGRVVNNGYDAANRVNAVTGLLQGQTKNYASPILYWPHGGLYYYGAGNGVTPAWYYNSRLQMSDIWARVQNDDNRWLLNLHNFWGTSDNNGNLQAVNEAYGNSVPFSALNWFGQTYTYDSVNRLSSGAMRGIRVALTTISTATCGWRGTRACRWRGTRRHRMCTTETIRSLA